MMPEAETEERLAAVSICSVIDEDGVRLLFVALVLGLVVVLEFPDAALFFCFFVELAVGMLVAWVAFDRCVARMLVASAEAGSSFALDN